MKIFRSWRCVSALLLAIVLLAGLPVLAADPVDLTKTCSITLEFGQVEAAGAAASGEGTVEQQRGTAARAELQAAEVQIAAYKLADAEEQTGYDAYTFAFNESFSDLASYYTDDMDTDAMKELAARAQALVTDDMQPITGSKAADTDKAELKGLEPGMYLVLLYSEGQSYGTVQTPSFEFTYSPVLVSVPTREAEEGAVPKTSDTGDWIYNVTVNLENKCEYTPRTGSIYIQKNYQDETGAAVTTTGVTCIFEVNAVQYGQTVLSNVYSMFFAAGTDTTKTLEIPDLPVGAVVTVTEVYAGAGASMKSASNTTVTVVAGTAQTAANTAVFVNTPSDTPPQGGSIVNKYTAAESAMEGQFDWNVYQLPDSMPGWER